MLDGREFDYIILEKKEKMYYSEDTLLQLLAII